MSLCNAGSRMSLGKWWLWALLGLLALWALMLYSRWAAIESDVQGRAQAALDANGYDWGRVDLHKRGRDILFTGEAPSEAVADEAISLLQNVEGVRVVERDLTINTGPTEAALAAMAAEKARLAAEVKMQAEKLVAEKARLATAAKMQSDNLMAEKARLAAVESAASKKAQMAMLATEAMAKSKMDAKAIAQKQLQAQAQVDTLASAARAEKARLAQLERDRIASAKQARMVFLKQCQTRINGVMAASKIEFASGSANIASGSHVLLKNLAGLVKECNQDGSLQIEIAGHTDSSGDDAMNQALSEQRANAVLSFLSSAGVSSGVLTAMGYGEVQPIADNGTSQGRARNRRIQFDIKQ
ncbi:MAG: OmpA family protein [Arenicellales bacterium]